MDEFHINFNIFGKNCDFESWQKAELSSPVKKRKRERKAAKKEKRNSTKFWMTETLLKIEDDRHKLNTKKSTVWAMSVLKDWLEDLNFRGRFISCVLKSVLSNDFVIGLVNYISLLKNMEPFIPNSNKKIVKRHTVLIFFFVLESSRVISGIMYRAVVITGK